MVRGGFHNAEGRGSEGQRTWNTKLTDGLTNNRGIVNGTRFLKKGEMEEVCEKRCSPTFGDLLILLIS